MPGDGGGTRPRARPAGGRRAPRPRRTFDGPRSPHAPAVSAPSADQVWSRWCPPPTAYTVGVEEEVMLLHVGEWSPCRDSDALLARFSPALRQRVGTETHAS